MGSAPTDEAGADSGAGDDVADVGTEGGFADTALEGDTPDASGEAAASDANVCMLDAATIVCCCEGDIGGDVVCNADGSLSCAASSVFPFVDFTLYYGADCTRPCGPCSVACVLEAGADAAD